MTRESAEAKGRRYLVEGRVVVEQVVRDHIVASVRGNGEVHTVTYSVVAGRAPASAVAAARTLSP